MRLTVTVVVVAAVAWKTVVSMCPPLNNDKSTRPEPCHWAKSEENRDAFLDWLIGGCEIQSSRCSAGEDIHAVEYEGYDGWYNNLARPNQGAVDTPLLRLLPPAYSDGVYQPVKRSTNPLTLSQMFMAGKSGSISKGGRTAFLVFFGQQVVEEILDAQGAGCPPEYFNIKVEENHRYHTDHPHLKELPVLRTRYDQTTGFSPNNPRQQLNEITPYLDGGLVYGTGKGWADVLRTFENGTLAPRGKLAPNDKLGSGYPAQNTQRLPMANPPPPFNHSQYVGRGYTAEVDRFFKLGNPRGNENPFILTFGILWYRWHNHIAEYLDKRHPRWTDEKIFNEARKWVIATYQAIVYYDWLPKYMRRELSPYQGYKPTTDPQVSHIFQSAAMRFGHTLVTSGVHLRERDKDLCGVKSFNRYGEEVGGVRTCNSFWLSPEFFTGDPGNFEKFLMGLSSQGSEKEDHVIVEDLRGEVDIWVGGLLETRNGPGQLFSKVILDQFERIRDADRFWFENTNNNLFTEEERRRLRQVNIIDVVLSVTDLLPDVDIQSDPFTAVHENNSVSEKCKQILSNQKDCHLFGDFTTTCRYLSPVDTVKDSCSPPGTYDYFDGSQTSYILTFTIVAGACVAFVVIRAKTKSKGRAKKVFTSIKARKISARLRRYVKVVLEDGARHIKVNNIQGQVLRTIEFTNVKEIFVRHLNDYCKIVLSAPHHYDLYLMFQDGFHGEKLKDALEKYCANLGVEIKYKMETWWSIKKGVTTVYEREKDLARFSRTVMELAFNKDKDARATADILSIATSKTSTKYTMQMTRAELATQLGMLPNSIFMNRLFEIMDSDKSGFITIKEFWDVMLVFAQGTPEEKAKLMFDIYDISNSGNISSDDLRKIVKATMGSEANNQDLDQVVNSMLQSIGLREGQNIDYDNFKKINSAQGNIFENVNIDITQTTSGRMTRGFSLYGYVPKGGFAAKSVKKSDDIQVPEEENTGEAVVTGPVRKQWNIMISNIKVNSVFWFWGFLYTIVMLLIFAERAYYYSVEREHSGLRRIAGYGVTVTRGAASAMMFTYSCLLVTMCRNLFSFLRSTAAHRFLPFDYMINFHRYIGFWALIWTVIHVIGHAINFYHISTQTPPDLTCLFRDFFRRTHVLPKFHYWCWGTVTGFTGVLLTLHTALIYSFAYFGRDNFFRWFWLTHNTYPVYYMLFILHGSGRLVQPPFFHYFFLGPCILFILDKLVSISRNTNEIPVISAKHLPSNVIRLEIQRPSNFNFQSGQWVKIASTGIQNQEYHPFTLSSAPHEENLTLHIRAIYMDGPFGEGHQTWWDFEVVVLVGGGIGVTPFASILKDIAFKLQHSKSLYRTKKVIFLWTTRSQKQYEWMTEILNSVEELDKEGIIRNHIFITQFKSKFDLRTIMLTGSGISLFTGLRAITHFSRPNFPAIFHAIKERYNNISTIGVFTCGHQSLSASVEQGCQAANKESGPSFRHYYENF
ncbi:Dual oxidase 2-like [Homarus americanus]|uniref:NAD(P)H oxidase (H2O2-forming) n=1 Tax=Homarus americanus TaxID=6706 RepID=A0A8J5J7F1_HOMAM|nr:Dual oxidase 2-like [Homarus americanus]